MQWLSDYKVVSKAGFRPLSARDGCAGHHAAAASLHPLTFRASP